MRAPEDVRGFEVRDHADEAVGSVDDLVIEPSSGRVRFLDIGSGGLLGIGRTHRFVPVDVIEGVAGGYVFLRTTKEHVEGAPAPENLDGQATLAELYAHFGLEPYWAVGYRAPSWTPSE